LFGSTENSPTVNVMKSFLNRLMARDEPLGLELGAERLGRVGGRLSFHDLFVGETAAPPMAENAEGASLLAIASQAGLPCKQVAQKTSP
jgi:hypothetical protein